MAVTAEDFYRSSNGDRWQLIHDTASGRSFVRHEPNLLSGGRTTDTEIEEFLNRTGSSPENLASWDQIKESKWLWEPFLYDQRPLKEATTDASPVQNLVRIHLEVVEVLERMIPEYSQ